MVLPDCNVLAPPVLIFVLATVDAPPSLSAANAGGVFVSALEIEQNRTFHQWHPDVVDQKLKDLMKQLFHDMYVQANEKHYELMGAANQLAFVRILQAMKLRGLY